MNPGDILIHHDFQFGDGSSKTKFFILLSDGQNHSYISAITTSQQKNRGTQYGCQNQDRFPNFFLPEHSCYFEEPTWVQMENYFEFNQAELDRVRKRKLYKKSELPLDLIKDLIQCAIESEDITTIQEQVLKKTLSCL